MEIIEPRLGLGIFMNLRMMQRPLGREDSKTFKYRITKYAYNTRLRNTTTA